MAEVKRGWLWRCWLWRPRFSLWAMLVLVTVVAIPLSYVAQRRSWNEARRGVYERLLAKNMEFSLSWPVREARAPSEIELLYFDAPIGSLPPEKRSVWDWWIDLCKEGRSPQITVLASADHVTQDRAGSSQLSDEDLRLFARYFPEVKHIILFDESQVSDVGLRCLAALPNLRGIDLDGLTRISGSFLKDISKGGPLVKLRFENLPKLDGRELQRLSSLSSLWSFTLRDCGKLTDDSLGDVHLPGSLESVDLCNRYSMDQTLKRWLGEVTLKDLRLDVDLSREVATAIAKQTKLQGLIVRNAPLIDEDFRFLGRCENLELLKLDCLPIEGAFLEDIPLPHQLEHLSLQGTLLSDKSLSSLRRFKRLLRLELNWTPISGEGFIGESRWPKTGELSLAGCRFSEAGKQNLARLIGPGVVDLPDNWTASDFDRFAKGKAPYHWTVSIEHAEETRQKIGKFSAHSPLKSGLYDMKIDRCGEEAISRLRPLLDAGLAVQARFELTEPQ